MNEFYWKQHCESMKEIVMELREISCTLEDCKRQLKRLAELKDREDNRKRILTSNEHAEVHRNG